jgi:phage terminase large subunit-like protein
MNHIYEYRNKIERGEIVTSKRIIQQYDKLVKMLDGSFFIEVPQMDGTSEQREFVFSQEHAARPIRFIESFVKQSLGAMGQPVHLELFQKAKYEAVYGFVDKESGLRLCNEVHTFESRKNGKTFESSAIGLHMQVGDGEGGPQVVCLATKKDQSRILFNEAVRMVTQSPDLCRVIRKRKTDMYSAFNFGTFEPLASDSNSLDGLNPHCAIIDELHAIKDRNLYDVVKQAMYARRQPLLSIITTAGFIRESIYDSLYDEDCAILDGIDGFYNPRLMTFIYELDNINEWTDFNAWQKSNPGLGTIKDFAILADNVEKAKRDVKFLPTLLTKDFNVRQTSTGSWLTFQEVDDKRSIDLTDLRESYAVGGVDLSSTTDLTCATLLVEKGDNLFVLQQYFIPEEVAEKKEKEDKVPYRLWHERGLVTFCSGARVNYSDVTAWFVKMRDEHLIYPLWIGYDSWGSQYWTEEMKQNAFILETVRQGARTMSQPMKELAAEFQNKRVVLDNNPVLKWCLTNCQTKTDENANITPVKGKNQKQRIDGAVSLIDAYVIYLSHREDYRNMQEG